MRMGIAAFFVIVLSVSPAFANGGGYQANQQGKGTLDLFTPAGTETVQIVREDLTIALGVRKASVAVRYRMKNTGSRVKATIGFPVESEKRDYFVTAVETKPTAEPLKTWLADSHYSISVDGEKLETRPVIEPPESAKIDERRQNLLGWIVSTIPFKADSEQDVEIRFETGLAYDHSFISSDYHDTGSTFYYRLSTGAVWKGPIASGRVTVTSTNPLAPVIEKPAGVFKQSAGSWTWDFADLEPTVADDIAIRTTPPRESHQAYDAKGERTSRYDQIGGVWHLASRDYTATASSALAPEGNLTYEPANLRGAGAWSEGAATDGTGEWVELTLDPPRVLDFIDIAAGYQDWQKRNAYAANNRPAKIRIVCDKKAPMERTLADESLSQLVPLDPSSDPVKKLRIEFLSVYKGSQFDDLCVSDIALLTPLKKKPVFKGAR